MTLKTISAYIAVYLVCLLGAIAGGAIASSLLSVVTCLFGSVAQPHPLIAVMEAAITGAALGAGLCGVGSVACIRTQLTASPYRWARCICFVGCAVLLLGGADDFLKAYHGEPGMLHQSLFESFAMLFVVSGTATGLYAAGRFAISRFFPTLIVA